MAKVVADAIVVRQAPGRQSDRVIQPCTGDGGPCPPLLFGLTNGREDVFIIEGPVAADGYDWYLAAEELEHLVGWIPAGDAAGPWVVPANPQCPQEPIELADVTVSAIERLELLACVGSNELTLHGWYPSPPPDVSSSETCQPLEERPFCWFGYDLLRPVETTWAGDANALEWVGDSSAGLTEPRRNSWITVRGHFDDPASSECYDGQPTSVILCRITFVVTEITSD